MRDPDIKNSEWKPAINKEWVNKLQKIHSMLGDPRLTEALVELGRRKLISLKQVAEIKAMQEELKIKARKNG